MRNLPIQFVQTRSEGDFLPRKGGRSVRTNLPKWITEALIEQNASAIRHSLDILRSEFEGREDTDKSGLPIIAIVSFHEKATALSYRMSIRRIFDSKDKINVIGMLDSRELIVKIDNIAGLESIASNFNEDGLSSLSNAKRRGIAAVIGLERFHALTEDNLTGHLLKVRLMDYLDKELNERTEKLFMQTCEELGLETEKVTYAEDLIIFTIERTHDEISLQRIAALDSVFSVKKMPIMCMD